MKINITKKRLIISIVALSVLLVGGAAVALLQKNPDNQLKAPSQGAPSRELNSVDYSPSAPAQSETSFDDPEPAPNKSPEKLDVIITASAQNQTHLQIRTLITTLLETGSCTLQLSKQGENTVTLSSPTVPIASTSTCEGFDIPLTSLTGGTWKAHVTVTSNNLTGNAEKEIEVKR